MVLYVDTDTDRNVAKPTATRENDFSACSLCVTHGLEVAYFAAQYLML